MVSKTVSNGLFDSEGLIKYLIFSSASVCRFCWSIRSVMLVVRSSLDVSSSSSGRSTGGSFRKKSSSIVISIWRCCPSISLYSSYLPGNDGPSNVILFLRDNSEDDIKVNFIFPRITVQTFRHFIKMVR